MQQFEKELRLNQLRLIVLVSTLVFVIMLTFTIYWMIDYNDKYGFFEKASAEVIDHQLIDGKQYDLLSYKVDGNEFRITTEYESKNDVGDTITIYFDESYPLGVIYKLDSRRILLPILSAVFGVVDIGLIIMYLLIKKGVVNSQKPNGTRIDQQSNKKAKKVVSGSTKQYIDKNPKKKQEKCANVVKRTKPKTNKK